MSQVVSMDVVLDAVAAVEAVANRDPAGLAVILANADVWPVCEHLAVAWHELSADLEPGEAVTCTGTPGGWRVLGTPGLTERAGAGDPAALAEILAEACHAVTRCHQGLTFRGYALSGLEQT